MYMGIMERKGSRIPMPFVDDTQGISSIKALLMILIPVIVMTITVNTGHQYSAGVVNSFESLFLGDLVKFTLWVLIPFLLMTISLGLIFGKELKGFFSGSLKKNWKLIVGIVLLGFLVSGVMSIAFKVLHIPVESNAAVKDFSLHSLGYISISNLLSLFNEEIIGLTSFIGSTILIRNVFKTSRNVSLWIGMLVSAVIFGMLHYDAYNGNIPQILLIIGSLRLVFNFSFTRSKNIVVSFVCHYIYDELIFIIAVVPVLLRS